MADRNHLAPADPAPAPSRLVLASSSPRRAELLARLGLTPTIRPAHVDETARGDESPDELVLRLARAKADTSAGLAMGDDGEDQVPRGDEDAEEVVLAADTVVVLNGEVFGKPRNEADARTMLRRLSGRTHQVMTGVAVRRSHVEVADLVTTAVTFRSFTDDEVAWYLGTGEPLDKAGGYGLQGAGAALVERIDGSDTNVIGLPLAEAVVLLRRVGFAVLTRRR